MCTFNCNKFFTSTNISFNTVIDNQKNKLEAYPTRSKTWPCNILRKVNNAKTYPFQSKITR